MVDTSRLKDLITESKISKELIAGKLGISLSSLNNKLSGRTGFYLEEVVSICRLMNIDKPTMLELFFDDGVGNMPTNQERA